MSLSDFRDQTQASEDFKIFEELLKKLLETIAIEQRYDDGVVTLEPLGNINCNLTTKLFRATIKSPNKSELKLFAKIAVFNEQFRKKALKDVYKLEMIFYYKVVRIFDWIQDKHYIQGDDRLIFSKFYGCNQNFLEESLVLEDLSLDGFKCWEASQTADYNHVIKVIEELAKFHALSMAYDAIDREGSKALLEEMKYCPPGDMEILKIYTNGAIDNAKDLIPVEYKDRFLKFMAEHGDMGPDSFYYRPIMKPVLRHGDFKNNNVMYRKRSDGKYEVTIIDFQTYHTGCGPADLVNFIYTGTDGDFRRKHYKDLTDCYYKQLCRTLQKFGVDADVVYPRKDFDYEVKSVRPYGLVSAVYFLPPMLTSATEAPSMNQETGVKNLVMRAGPHFKRLLNEIIEEFIQLSIL